MGMWSRSGRVLRWKEHPAYDTVTGILGWLYVHFFLPHCFLAFPLLTFERYGPAYKELVFLEYFFFIGWLVWGKLIKLWLLSPNRKEEGGLVEKEKAEGEILKKTE